MTDETDVNEVKWRPAGTKLTVFTCEFPDVTQRHVFHLKEVTNDTDSTKGLEYETETQEIEEITEIAEETEASVSSAPEAAQMPQYKEDEEVKSLFDMLRGSIFDAN